MCGIYASIGVMFDKIRLDRIKHRGPDDEGLFEVDTIAGSLVLGHRRLAIIDTDRRSAQPIFNSNTGSYIILNGEIYNFREIRDNLEREGIEFSTSSDSETLLKALDFWGDKCLDMLRGMFAFIYYDKPNQRFLVVRDPYGIKPIYYKFVDNGIAFASEPKQIFDLGEKAKLNLQIAADYLLHSVTDHCEHTFFSNILQLRGGQKIEIDLSKPFKPSDLKISRWYHAPYQKTAVHTFEEAKQHFRELFDREIKLHCESDVAIGACLSGGLDSSAIVGALSTGNNNSLDTFSAVFPGEPIDESKFISSVVDKFSTSSHEVIIDENSLEDNLKKVIWHQDEPFGSCSILLQYYVFQVANKNGIKVVLDGQGADEQLAGYHGLMDFAMISYLRNGNLIKFIRHIFDRKKLHDISIISQLDTVFKSIFNKYVRQNNAPEWLEGSRIKDLQPCGSIIQRSQTLNKIEVVRNLKDQCYLLSLSTSLPMLLRFEDRNSMAFGVEARVPFVGRDLIEYSLSLADKFKLDGARTKVILREALKEYLPIDIYGRMDKIGFAPPEEKWLRGPLKPTLQNGIKIFFIRFPNLLNEKAIWNKFDDFAAGGTYNSLLWRVANIGLWAEMFDITE